MGRRIRSCIVYGAIGALVIGGLGLTVSRFYRHSRTFLSDVNDDGIKDLLIDKPAFFGRDTEIYIGEKKGSYAELKDYLKMQENPEETLRIIEGNVEKIIGEN